MVINYIWRNEGYFTWATASQKYHMACPLPLLLYNKMVWYFMYAFLIYNMNVFPCIFWCKNLLVHKSGLHILWISNASRILGLTKIGRIIFSFSPSSGCAFANLGHFSHNYQLFHCICVVSKCSGSVWHSNRPIQQNKIRRMRRFGPRTLP